MLHAKFRWFFSFQISQAASNVEVYYFLDIFEVVPNMVDYDFFPIVSYIERGIPYANCFCSSI